MSDSPLLKPDALPHLERPKECTSESLREAVFKARALLAQERHMIHGQSEAVARAYLLAALEAYVHRLDKRGFPIPYALRDELRLQRIACRAGRFLRPTTAGRGVDHGN